MELEIIEVIAEFRVIINAEIMAIPVKARIVKHAEDKDESCWYETSHVYKEIHAIEAYTPGASGRTIEETKSKLFDYLNKFQTAIDEGGTFELARQYIN